MSLPKDFDWGPWIEHDPKSCQENEVPEFLNPSDEIWILTREDAFLQDEEDIPYNMSAARNFEWGELTDRLYEITHFRMKESHPYYHTKAVDALNNEEALIAERKASLEKLQEHPLWGSF